MTALGLSIVCDTSAANFRFPPSCGKAPFGEPKNRRPANARAPSVLGFVRCGNDLRQFREVLAVAARRNSSFAPHGPLSRSLPRPGMRLRCANSISTFFSSFTETSYYSVLAMSRASSCSSLVMARAYCLPRWRKFRAGRSPRNACARRRPRYPPPSPPRGLCRSGAAAPPFMAFSGRSDSASASNAVRFASFCAVPAMGYPSSRPILYLEPDTERNARYTFKASTARS